MKFKLWNEIHPFRKHCTIRVQKSNEIKLYITLTFLSVSFQSPLYHWLDLLSFDVSCFPKLKKIFYCGQI